MKILDYEVKILDNYLIITPNEEIKDNKIYELKLKNISSINGEILNEEYKVCTKLSPMYASILSVKSLISNVDIEEYMIAFNIREASRYADYLKYRIDEENIPFEVFQFVRYKAAYDTLLNYSVHQASTTGYSGQVGEVTFSEKETSVDFSKILKALKAELDKWQDELRGFGPEGRVAPKAAIKSKYGYPKYGTANIKDYNRGIYDV